MTHVSRLASPGSVHLIPTGAGSAGQKGNPAISRPVSLTSSPAPRPGTVLPVAGARVSVAPAMAAVSFRPSGPLVTTARPSLSPTASGTVSLVQSSVTKTIVTQNPAGVFKPITTQVSVTGAPVALKPSPVSGALPVRVPGGQRTVTVMSQPLAVSLSQAPTHIQVYCYNMLSPDIMCVPSGPDGPGSGGAAQDSPGCPRG